jgi:hypothetical protein
LLNIIQTGSDEGKAKACGAMSKLGFRNTYNVLNMMKHPGLLDALIDLLSEDKNNIKVQVQAWRVLQNCCSGIEEVKVIICSNQSLVSQLKVACESSNVSACGFSPEIHPEGMRAAEGTFFIPLPIHLLAPFALQLPSRNSPTHCWAKIQSMFIACTCREMSLQINACIQPNALAKSRHSK